MGDSDLTPPPGWRTCRSQNLHKSWTCERQAEVTHPHETEEGAVKEAWERHDDAARKQDPVGFGDLRAWWGWGGEQFITDVMDVIIENESDDKRGFTCQELRDLLEAHYDKAYAPEDRHVEVKPTQRQVNMAVEHLLMDPTNAYEHEDHIFLHRNEIEEKKIEKEIMEVLKGDG